MTTSAAASPPMTHARPHGTSCLTTTAIPPPPSHILILGGGEFGLATCLSLLRRPAFTSSRITLIDSSATLPNPSGSSVDASRIIRADYGNAVYARLAAEAQHSWRDTSDTGWGGQGRYHEPGFLLTADDEATGGYVRKSLGNVRGIASEELTGFEKGIEELKGPLEIQAVSGHEGVSGEWGYVNWNSGWADAEACVRFALDEVEREGAKAKSKGQEGKVVVRTGCRVRRLLSETKNKKEKEEEERENEGTGRRSIVTGAELDSGEKIAADLVILAAGAWSPSLVDLQGRAVATAQVLTYTEISDAEAAQLKDNPTVMNLSRGMFIIPPRCNELKVARHGFGYRNLVNLKAGEELLVDEHDLDPDSRQSYRVSVPRVGIQAPREGINACRAALREMMPNLGERPFKNTRLCWYCDTPDGDFLIDWHPRHEGLFLATGGSGHGFKFFPVIGDKIVDALEGKLQEDLRSAWSWRKERVKGFEACEDGSRAGPRGMILDDELRKGDVDGDGDVGKARL